MKCNDNQSVEQAPNVSFKEFMLDITGIFFDHITGFIH